MGNDEHDWYYEADGRQAGPVGTAELKGLIRRKAVTRATRVWHEGMADWVAASSIAGLFPQADRSKQVENQSNPTPAISILGAVLILVLLLIRLVGCTATGG